MRHVIPISGKDSLATYIVQSRRQPEIDYEVIYNDTSLELPETYQWLSSVEQSLDIKIKRIGKDLNEIIYEQGILPSPKVRYCTRLSKIYPMEDYFGKEETTVYFGIRADEKRTGYTPTKRASITPQYPLIEMGIKLADVYQILTDINLMPPVFFWKEVYDRVVANVGVKSVERLERHEFNMLFSWRSRPNCYNCFYQRQYELIGLSEHHPELFEAACTLEEEVGAENFTIRKGYSLRNLLDKRDEIINRRVKEVTKHIMQKSQTRFLIPYADELMITSCGLFCGK